MLIIQTSLYAGASNSLEIQIKNTDKVVYLLFMFFLVILWNNAFRLNMENSFKSSGFKSNGSINSH